MNTKNKQDQKTKGRRTRQENGPRKRDRNLQMHHEQELPETRLTR